MRVPPLKFEPPASTTRAGVLTMRRDTVLVTAGTGTSRVVASRSTTRFVICLVTAGIVRCVVRAGVTTTCFVIVLYLAGIKTRQRISPVWFTIVSVDSTTWLDTPLKTVNCPRVAVLTRPDWKAPALIACDPGFHSSRAGSIRTRSERVSYFAGMTVMSVRSGVTTIVSVTVRYVAGTTSIRVDASCVTIVSVTVSYSAGIIVSVLAASCWMYVWLSVAYCAGTATYSTVSG